MLEKEKNENSLLRNKSSPTNFRDELDHFKEIIFSLTSFHQIFGPPPPTEKILWWCAISHGLCHFPIGSRLAWPGPLPLSVQLQKVGKFIFSLQDTSR